MASIKCNECGKELELYWANIINLGRGSIYLCDKCLGNAEARVSDSLRNFGKLRKKKNESSDNNRQIG